MNVSDRTAFDTEPGPGPGVVRSIPTTWQGRPRGCFVGDPRRRRSPVYASSTTSPGDSPRGGARIARATVLLLCLHSEGASDCSSTFGRLANPEFRRPERAVG
jgi:hypothetical protein